MDTSVFDAVFWSFFITTMVGFILKLSSMAYKSKCKNCDICFGLIRIVRDVEAEEKETEFRLLHPTPQKETQLNESKDTFV
jgi:hypothetical protein